MGGGAGTPGSRTFQCCGGRTCPSFYPRLHPSSSAPFPPTHTHLRTKMMVCPSYHPYLHAPILFSPPPSHPPHTHLRTKMMVCPSFSQLGKIISLSTRVLASLLGHLRGESQGCGGGMTDESGGGGMKRGIQKTLIKTSEKHITCPRTRKGTARRTGYNLLGPD